MGRYKYIFGPVPSRRLGFSLGIDIIPHKTCSYDCIYCQLGPTTDKTVFRKEYVSPDLVLEEIKRKLKEDIQIDYLSFSGSGEPTLNSRIGEIISDLKKLTSIPVAVITNGSLFFMRDVREALRLADVVLPTVSTARQSTFLEIHRPHPELDLGEVLNSMIEFRRGFRGEIWLELFLVRGRNDSEEEVSLIKPWIEKISPDRVHLNSEVRISAEETCLSVPFERMKEIALFLGPKAEIISDFAKGKLKKSSSATEDDVLSFLKRRPGTVEEISCGLQLEQELVSALVKKLLRDGKIKSRMHEGKMTYYFRVKAQTNY